MENTNCKYYTIKNDGLGLQVYCLQSRMQIVPNKALLFNINSQIRELESDGFIYVIPEEYDALYNLFMNNQKVS